MVRFLSSLWWRRYISRNSIPWDELQSFPELSPPQQRRDMAERLLSQIHYFGRRSDALPEWREAARINDPDELWKVWPSLPIIGKHSLQTRFIATATRDLCGLPGKLNSSGGSTGEAVHFFHDNRMVKSTMAANFYTRMRMGWKIGMPAAVVWGSERDIKKDTSRKHRINSQWFLNEFLVDGYHMTDATVDRVVGIIRRHRPLAIFGFTSMLQYVAERVVERGIRIPPGAVQTAWNGGEMLYEAQSEIFRKAFGVPILNRYGGRELSVMACQYQAGGLLEVLRPWVFLEIVDDAGKPVAPGGSGRLIVTSTICRGTPFLRFDVGDLGMAAPQHVSESGIGALSELHGRFSGLLELPNGMCINNLYWNHLLKEFPEVKQFQIVLKGNGSIFMQLRGDGFQPEREAKLRDILGSFLHNISVEIVWVDSIPLTSQGKLVQVVRESA